MKYNNYITLNEFISKFNPNDKIENINRIGHNSFYYIHNGQRKIRYTNTDIIIFSKKNRYIQLYTGGYYTNTTKERINRYLNHGYIYQSKNIWYYKQYEKEKEKNEIDFYTNKKGFENKIANIRFFEGIKIDIKTGNVLNKNKAPKTNKIDKFNKKLIILINKYCDKINELHSLPSNTDGDCLYCTISQKINSNRYHLLSHLEEKYIMKTLIINALKEKLYNPYIIYENNKIYRNDIINAVKKYFKKYLFMR